MKRHMQLTCGTEFHLASRHRQKCCALARMYSTQCAGWCADSKTGWCAGLCARAPLPWNLRCQVPLPGAPAAAWADHKSGKEGQVGSRARGGEGVTASSLHDTSPPGLPTHLLGVEHQGSAHRYLRLNVVFGARAASSMKPRLASERARHAAKLSTAGPKRGAWESPSGYSLSERSPSLRASGRGCPSLPYSPRVFSGECAPQRQSRRTSRCEEASSRTCF